MNMTTAIPVGKYLVSPMARRTATGHYAASVSIRSGKGSGTHDRVLRFTPRFSTQLGAQQYAIAEGLSWLHTRHRACSQPHCIC